MIHTFVNKNKTKDKLGDGYVESKLESWL